METVLTAAFLAAVILLLYVAMSRNPIRKCPRCNGKGTIPSAVLSGRYRVCPRCSRRGEVKAWGGKD